MFKFLKDKIKGAIGKLTKKIEEPIPEVPQSGLQEQIPEAPAPPEFQEKIAEPLTSKEKILEKLEIKKEILEKPKEIIKEELKVEKAKPQTIDHRPQTLDQKQTTEQEVKKVVEEEKKGFFAKIAQKITTTKIDEQKFDESFWDLELILLENNVAVEVVEKIKNDLKKALIEKPITRGKVEETILSTLKNSIQELFEKESFDLIEKIKNKKPFVICFVGINGSGKTTTIAKIASMLKDKKFDVVMAAADTFRAAAIDQLQIHADKLGIKLIKHEYGADAAAVAYDAIEHAKAKNKDVVLIDTAGRLHSNTNLVDEMKKIIRVSKPDLKVFVGESITGNDCIEQAKKFDEAINIDGIILSKIDIDEKGGAAISVSYVTKKPILYMGTGQEYDDLEVFSKEKIMSSLGI